MRHDARRAIRRSGVTYLHAELDQPLMGVSLIAGGRDRVDRVRSFLSGGVLDDVEALKDAQDMCVDGDAVFGK